MAVGLAEKNAGQAALNAAGVFISSEIKKIVAKYISEAFSKTGFFGGLAAVAAGGFFPGGSKTCTEEFNGSTWSTSNGMITARYEHCGAGTLNAGIIFGGQTPGTPILACTECYDGTSWSVGTALPEGRKQGGGGSAGTQNASIFFGGVTNASYQTSTRELTQGDEVYYNRATCVRCVTGTCTQIN